MKYAMLFAVAALVSTPLAAQEISGYPCSGFVRHSDGSWTTLQSLQLRSVSVGPGEKLIPGVMLGGVDFAPQLDKACAR